MASARRQTNRTRTHRGEDLGRVVPDRVLPAPLLQQEDHNSNHEPHKVPLAQERLPCAQPLARLALLLHRRLDLRHLPPHPAVVRVRAPEVREVRERLLGAALGRQPPRRLSDREEPERHEARGDELEAERDAPHREPLADVQANTHCNIKCRAIT